MGERDSCSMAPEAAAPPAGTASSQAWPLVFKSLSDTDIAVLATLSKSLKEAAYSQHLWKQLLLARFGHTKYRAALDKETGRPVDWRRLYAQAFDAICVPGSSMGGAHLDGDYLTITEEPGSESERILRVNAVCGLSIGYVAEGVLPGRYRISCRMMVGNSFQNFRDGHLRGFDIPPEMRTETHHTSIIATVNIIGAEGTEPERVLEAVMDLDDKPRDQWFWYYYEQEFDVKENSDVYWKLYNANGYWWKRALYFDVIKLQSVGRGNDVVLTAAPCCKRSWQECGCRSSGQLAAV